MEFIDVICKSLKNTNFQQNALDQHVTNSNENQLEIFRVSGARNVAKEDLVPFDVFETAPNVD